MVESFVFAPSFLQNAYINWDEKGLPQLETIVFGMPCLAKI